MKKYLILITAFVLLSGSANAGELFGAGLKPKPNFTLFGQTITWPIPSLCVGKAAGVLPDAKVSSDGISVKLPWLAIDIPFPSLILNLGKDKPKIELKLGAVNKSEHKETE